jgi:hypothetical protein
MAPVNLRAQPVQRHLPRSAEIRNEREYRMMDMELEVVVLPVSDVDRAKAFYQGLGWRT